MDLFDAQVWTFTLVVALLTLTPGADTMLVIRNVLARGGWAGVLTTLGIGSGLFVHASLSALGLSLLLVRSAAAFNLVKLAGAGYLIYLGLRSLIAGLRATRGEAGAILDPLPVPGESEPADPSGLPAAGAEISPWRSVLEGLLTNLLNPKVAVFYLAFLPQFIGPGDPVLAKSILLAAIHFLQGLVWLTFVSVFIGRMRVWLTHPSVHRWLELASGAALIGFGVRLALERR